MTVCTISCIGLGHGSWYLSEYVLVLTFNYYHAQCSSIYEKIDLRDHYILSKAEQLTGCLILLFVHTAPSSWETSPTVAYVSTGVYTPGNTTKCKQIKETKKRMKGNIKYSPSFNHISVQIKVPQCLVDRFLQIV